jgi:hypothetical protein
VREKRVVPRMPQAADVQIKMNTIALILLVIVWRFSGWSERRAMW